jgi:dihydroxyacetone kinase DhaKLM complex PTS-EIIA-like component DhaM
MLQRYLRGNRDKVAFKAAVLSHSGEMSSGIFDLVQWIVGHRKRVARKGGSLYDGRQPSRVATDFRKNLKDAIQVTAARTIGYYIASTGLCY